MPDAWPGFTLKHRRPDGTSYVLSVGNPSGNAAQVTAASLDGISVPVLEGVLRLPLAHDGARHLVILTLGAGSGTGR